MRAPAHTHTRGRRRRRRVAGSLSEQPDFLTNNSPEGKPVWLYSSGSMYVGQWKEQGTEEGHAVEHGYGVTYLSLNRMPRALVYFGKRKDGILNAMPGSKILT